jgi:DNA phosphorothioation-dependent restriction protein DptG
VAAAPKSGLNQDAALWLGCLDRIIACAVDIAETARIKADEGSDARLLASCLLARSVSTARAVVHLIGLSHVVEARMLARSIFENEFYLYRLAQDGSAFAREMFADEVYHRGAGGETIFKEEQAREAMGEESRARMRAFIKGLRQESQNAKPLKPKDAISGTDVSAAYVFYQQLSFDAGHPSLTALNRHVVETTENEIVGLSFQPRIKDGEVMDTAFLAVMALLGVCISANTALGGTAGGERLEGLVAEYHEVAARTHPPASSRISWVPGRANH